MTEPGKSFDLARTMADTARSIDGPRTLEETLDAIVHAARASVPGFEHVGISVVEHDGTVSTLAATGRLVRELDMLQYKLGEGPCLSAMREETVVLVEHLAQEQRWPRFVPRAVQAGVKAQMGVQLFHGGTVGGLNFYSTASETVDPEAPRHAELFATHAALALGHARRSDEAAAAAHDVQVVGQAVGMLVERYEITADRAFDYLVRVSSRADVLLPDVAREVVAQGDRRAHEAAESETESQRDEERG